MSACAFDAERAIRDTVPRKSRSASGSTRVLGDQALIGSIAVGDEFALGQLYDRFGALAYRLALRVARDPGLAEEAVQDAFLSAWRSASSFDGERGSARTWLLTLVHRRAVDLVRRAARRQEEPLEAPPEIGRASTPETMELRAEQKRVRTALEFLPAGQRQAIELAYYGGYSQSQIAGLLNLPLGTIKSRVFAGLSRFRNLLLEQATWVSGAREVEGQAKRLAANHPSGRS